jgi:uncharacterized repeat protein (TIGR01451 family)
MSRSPFRVLASLIATLLAILLVPAGVGAQTTTDLGVVHVRVDGPVVAGGNTSYRLLVTNHGTATAADVVLEVDRPTGTTLLFSAGDGFSCGSVGLTLTCTRSSLDPGATATVDYEVRVPSDAPEGGTIVSHAEVSATTPDGNPANDADDESRRVIAGVPPFGFIQFCSPPFTQLCWPPQNGGQYVSTQDLVVTYDAGPEHCSQVRVHYFRDGTEVAVSPFIDPSGKATVVVPWVDDGQPHHLTFAGEGRVGGCNTGILGAWSGTVIVEGAFPAADLRVAYQDAGPALPGASGYTIQVANDGPNLARNLVLEIDLPEGTTFESASGSDWTCEEDDLHVTCTRPSLASGLDTAVFLSFRCPTTRSAARTPARRPSPAMLSTSTCRTTPTPTRAPSPQRRTSRPR